VQVNKEEKQNIKMFSIDKQAAIKQRIGVLIAGIDGNNGSTLWALHTLTKKRERAKQPPMYGSLISLGDVQCLNKSKPVALHSLLDEVGLPAHLDQIVAIDGWGGRKTTMWEALLENKVITDSAQLEELRKDAQFDIRRGIVYPEFIGLDLERHTLGSAEKDEAYLSKCIDNFAILHQLTLVVIIYSGCTERNVENDKEISPSRLYALAAAKCLTNACFINGAAQETLTPELMQLFNTRNRICLGNDLCTGQTRLKHTILGTFVPQGMPATYVVSGNYLGNSDGKNLRNNATNYSKLQSKAYTSNRLSEFAPTLYQPGGRELEQLVQISYVKAIGDNKRAIDEMCFDLPCGAALNMHTTSICPDTPLAMGVLLDLLLLCGIFDSVLVTVWQNYPHIVRKLKCDEANALCACLLKHPQSAKARMYFHEARDALVGALLEICGQHSETLRHRSIFRLSKM